MDVYSTVKVRVHEYCFKYLVMDSHERVERTVRDCLVLVLVFQHACIARFEVIDFF